MKKSLQRQLTLMLVSALLIAGLVAAAASFGLAFLEAEELQDNTLRQIAVLMAGRTVGPADTMVRREGDKTNSDPESRLVVVQMPPDSRPDWLPDVMSPGFHTLSAGSGTLRVFARDDESKGRTIVAQRTDVRNEIAIDSALRTLIPLLLLLPLLAWLMLRIVRSGFSPVTRLAGRLDRRAVDEPGHLADEGLPAEITPFVDAINRLLIRVNNLLNQQRRFIADAAHELRTPLTALSVQAQNVCKAETLGVAQERMVPLQQGIERARQLTEQLLGLARTQSGSLELSEVNLSELARELIAEFLPVARARSIDLGLDEAVRLLARTSPGGLRLILRNALENSLKYTPDGGEVTLRVYEDGGCFVMEVVDNGPGIPAEEREHVFDAFFRLPGMPASGSGLGLAIARECAIRIGGSVALCDRPNQPGIVFRYRQPRNR